MSKSIEAFVTEVLNNPQLIESIQSRTIGMKELVEYANSQGYHFSEAEAREYLKDSGVQDHIRNNVEGAAASSAAVQQNVAAQTQAAAMAEAAVVEAAAEVTTAATTVFVVAEAAIILT